MRPLEGILVIEFCQYLAGPSAGLKLADLGARVIKIEVPEIGEGSRQIAIKNLFVNGDSLVFHTMNRNKESFAANLKNEGDLMRVKKLLSKADIMTHNFRPGVMQKFGLNYESVIQLNPKIIYAVVTGYGKKGPWANKPGQDLLIQALSGLTYLTGSAEDNPTPMGLATSDILTGNHLTQGILAALIKRSKTRKSVLVEVSLLESTLDFQFEVLTTYFNDGGKKPKRAKKGNAHAYLSAPYGIYKTKDSYISIAMMPVTKLFELIGIDIPKEYESTDSWFDNRDEIMDILNKSFIEKNTQDWLDIFEPKDVWCSEVYQYKDLVAHEGYKILEMDQEVTTSDGKKIRTTRCPIRINGQRYFNSKSAPKVGENTASIIKEFDL